MNANVELAFHEAVASHDIDAAASICTADANEHHPYQPLVILLMGLPAAGKSTFYARELAARGIKNINLDTLRTRHRELRQIQEYLQKGISFAVDNTNTLPEERA